MASDVRKVQAICSLSLCIALGRCAAADRVGTLMWMPDNHHVGSTAQAEGFICHLCLSLSLLLPSSLFYLLHPSFHWCHFRWTDKENLKRYSNSSPPVPGVWWHRRSICIFLFLSSPICLLPSSPLLRSILYIPGLWVHTVPTCCCCLWRRWFVEFYWMNVSDTWGQGRCIYTAEQHSNHSSCDNNWKHAP